MDFFIYRWDYIDNYIYGATHDGYVKIKGFIPWIYQPSDEGSLVLKKLHGSEEIKVKKVLKKHNDAVLQFLTFHDIDQVGWIHVDKYVSVDGGYYVHLDDIKPLSYSLPPELHIVAFDIEVYSSTKGFPKSENKEDVIICISLMSNKYGAITYTGNENDIVQSFYQYLTKVDVLMGYNTHGFDWKYIRDRHGPPLYSKYPNVESRWVSRQWSSSALMYNDITYLDMPGVIDIDVYMFCRRTYKMNDYRLSTIGSYFNVGVKHDLSVEQMWEDYKKGEMKRIIDYCEHDCCLVLDISEKCHLLKDVFALSSVTYTSPDILVALGQQIRVKNMIKRECYRYGYLASFKRRNENVEESYEGAIVITPKPGLYDHCACMDFASLYPSIIVSENICYTTYDDHGGFRKNIFGIIPNLVSRLIRRRNEVRHCPEMSAYSNALKICSNSIYGVFGAKGDLYLLEAASMITRVGRESLMKAVEYLKNQGYNVIYGDTDSCIYTSGKEMMDEEHEKIAGKVTSLFNDPIQMKYEGMYHRFLVLGKKMYITMNKNNVISYKGVMAARRDSCSFSIQFYREVIRRVMMNERFRDYIRNEIRNIRKYDREMFVIKKTYNGPYKMASFPMQVYNEKYGPLNQGQNVYVIVSYGKLLGDRMRPYESEDEIDYEWYLTRLINPIDHVMEATGKVFRLKHNIELLNEDMF
jgi:DNA polymerase elongation subunit (family B)